MSRVPASPGVCVRFLRPGEEALWSRCSLNPEARAQGDRFTREASFRPEAHLIAERGGFWVGRMESILAEPHEAILVDPIVVPGASVPETAAALLGQGIEVAQDLHVGRILLILQDRLPYLSELSVLVTGWGFLPVYDKRLYVLDPKALPASLPPVPGLEFRPLDAPDGPVARRTLDRILERPLNRYDAGETAESLLARLMDRDRESMQDWVVAFLYGEPAGLVFPSLLYPGARVGTILFVGLVPEHRGRGLGLRLQWHGLRSLLSRHRLESVIGSCDEMNLPMVRIFEALGYRPSMRQLFFKLEDNKS